VIFRSQLRRLLPSLLLLAPAAGLALDWSQLSVPATTKPFQRRVELVFPFRNSGAHPVTITAIDPSCDCTNAAVDKLVYQPGESGRLTAVIAVGERYGRYVRSILVTASDAPNPVRLEAIIDSPELAVLTPRTLLWKTGQTAGEQSVDIAIAPELRLDIDEVLAINDRFTLRLETIVPGHHYRLFVKPAATAEPANTAVRLICHDEAGHKTVLSAYANVE